MTSEDIAIADLASELVRWLQAKDGKYEIKQSALQVAQHVLGHAEQIANANKPKSPDAKKPDFSGKFL